MTIPRRVCVALASALLAATVARSQPVLFEERFEGYGYADRFAWYDFAWNDEHGSSGSVELSPGRHVVLIRVRGGRYASGGFFAALLPAAP